MTAVPPLRIALTAAPTTSSLTMSTVMIALSAPTPRVRSCASSWASSALATLCVAPEVVGHLALVGQRVDGDDVGRARVVGALDGVGADAADAVDDHGLARHHVGGVDRAAPAGRDAAADEHDGLQRQVLVDAHAARLGDHAVLAEGAEHAHPADVVAFAVEAERAVGHAAVEDRRAEVADVRVPGGAEAAVAADGQERGDDVVALLDPRDARPDLLDDAGALVAADDREARDDVPVAEVLVGVAQAGGDPADQHLPLLGLVEIQLGDLPIATGVPQHGCPGLHGFSPPVTPTSRSYTSSRFRCAAEAPSPARRAQRLAAEALARPA